jgi:mRNA interferase MazF
MGVRRGDIWWVNLGPTQGSEIRKSRPAVVITANALNRARRTVIVVPLSTGPNSVAVCDQLRAVDKRRLTRMTGQLSAADLQTIGDSIRRILQL